VLLKLVSLFAPLRVSSREEGMGLDVTQHGEEAYAHDEGAILVLPDGGDAGRGAAAARLAPEGGRA
jgi:Amt family ammonium transporter